MESAAEQWHAADSQVGSLNCQYIMCEDRLTSRYLPLLLLFLISASSAVAQNNRPILLSQTTSTRAIAFESPSFSSEPFKLRSSVPWSIDQRTRVMLFTLNLTLLPGDDLSAITADAEDSHHHVFSLGVEYLGPVPSQEWLSAIVLRLNDELDDVGDVLVRVKYRGVPSNRVRIAIGHIGGGPPDDPGANPTPPPPYVISGRVSSQGIGLSGVSLSLAGMPNQIAQTDNSGAYSFTVSRYGNYSIAASAPFYNFRPQIFVIDFLAGNLANANFDATRQTYTIAGHTKEGTRPISGVSVTLSGGSSRSTVTDAAGAFSFPNLEAGRSYTITPTKANFDFTPRSQQIESLEADRTIDMVGMPAYPLTGHVTDEDGFPLAGVSIKLSGAESATIQTANDGTYSFIVHTAGDYSLSSSMDQNYYSFSPAIKVLPDVDGARVTDFTGTLSLATDPSYVLEFDGTPKTVDAGVFWPGGEPLGHFFWEVWAMPGENAGATYLISDGYGGAHALLFGFGFYGASEASRYQLFGNVWNGSTWTFFSSNEGPAVGEWAHLAVGWDGHQIISYFNGVPVGSSPFNGPRISPGPNGGGGRLLIGGSDHNNLIGRIAQVHGYEDTNPRELTSATAAFAPEAVFRRDGAYLNYFFRPSFQIADLSHYYRQQAHRSRLRGTLYPYGLLYECPASCPLPVFVVDSTAPNFLNSPVNNSAPISAAPPTPTGQ